MRKRAGLFSTIVILFSLLLISTLLLFGLAFRVTFGREIQSITMTIGQKQAAAVLSEIGPFLTDDLTIAKSDLETVLAREQQRFYARIFLLSPEGAVLASSDPPFSSALSFSPQQLSAKATYPATRIIRGVLVPFHYGGHKRGYLLYQPIIELEDRVGRRFTLLLIIIGTINLFGIYSISRFLTRPLRRLSHSVQRIADGEHDHRIAETGSREFATLAHEFNIMKDRLFTVLSNQRQFLAGISHEIRSPLARMRLALELSRDRGSDVDSGKRIDAITEEIEIIDSLLGELIEISRLQIGEHPLILESVNLLTFLEDTCTQYKNEVGRDNSQEIPTITVSCHHDPGIVTLDSRRMQRVLFNLFENSRRHSTEQPVLQITVDLIGREAAILKIRDFGTGLSQEARENLFLPFSGRSGERSATNMHGLGLGLYIARDIIVRHGGTIEFENATDGPGTLVTLTLPLQKT